MKNPDYFVSDGKGKIQIVLKCTESTKNIEKQLLSLGADDGVYSPFISMGEKKLRLTINPEKFNVPFDLIKDLLSEYDDEIINITQFISLDDIVSLLPEISNVAEHLYKNNAIDLNKHLDKFRLRCVVYDQDSFYGLGLDIETTMPLGDGSSAYISVYIDSIHDLRKLKLIGFMDSMPYYNHMAHIIIPGFVLASYPYLL